MSALGMSSLVSAMVAAGGPCRIDVRDHRHLHAALLSLSSDTGRSERFPALVGHPDAEVGLRVHGVTSALWSLTGSGFFNIERRDQGASFVACEEATPAALRELMRLSHSEREAVCRAAAVWAAADSTSRKKRDRAMASSGETRRSRDLNRRQVRLPASRQRDVNAN